MRSVFLTPDGASIDFEKHGDGKPIVFIHGFSLDKSMWNNQVEYFSRKYFVVTYDMRGFGNSSLPNDTYSHHKDLFDLLNYLGVKNMHLVGLSLGGEVAIDFTLTYPKMVNTLTLVDSSLGGFKSTVNWDVHAKEAGIEKAKENWLAHEVFKYSFENNKDVKDFAKQIVRKYSGWHWTNKDPRIKLDNPTAKDRLGEITQRTQILVGDNDLNYYKEIANLINKQVKMSEKDIIPKAGHLSNMDNNEYFNQKLDEFFNQ